MVTSNGARAATKSMVEAALEYAAMGWRVFPLYGIIAGQCACSNAHCKDAGKHPRIKGWQKKATTDEAIIRRLWKETPRAGIGILTGNGLSVLDVDPAKEGGESLAALGALPMTPKVKTGGDGEHHYFSSNGHEIKNSQGALGKGLDTRGTGGYVVAPPSPHVSGGQYEWTVEPSETPLADFPEDLRQRLSKGGAGAVTTPENDLKLLVQLVIPHWKEGQRNAIGLALAGACANTGWPYELTEQLFQQLVEEGGDDEDRSSLTATTYKRLRDGLSVQGYSGLIEHLPQPAVAEIMQAIAATRAPTGMRHIDSVRLGKGAPFLKKRRIAGIVERELREQGSLFRTDEPRYFWLNEDTRQLMDSTGHDFAAYINREFGLNPVEDETKYVLKEMQSNMQGEPPVAVHRSFYFDQAAGVLYMQLNHATVAALDGASITEEANGDTVLFEGSGMGIDKLPAASGKTKPFEWLLKDIAFDEAAMPERLQRVLLLYAMKVIPFIDLCLTRPIIAYVGPKGAGKTLQCRKVLKFFLGPDADVATVADEDDAETASLGTPILGIDNLDQRVKWVEDFMAKTATGHVIVRRELYTTARKVEYRPHCWLIVNARTPEFKREDVADRLLLFRLARRVGFTDARKLLEGVLDPVRRAKWISDYLVELNDDVAAVKVGGGAVPPGYRMQDWARLAIAIAHAEGQGDLLNEAITALQGVTTEFTLEDSPIREEMASWPGGRKMRTTGELWNFVDKSVFKSPYALGAALRRTREGLLGTGELEAEYDKGTKVWTYRRT